MCGIIGHLAAKCHRRFKRDFLGIGNDGRGNKKQAAIADIIHYTNSRLQTVLKPAPPESEGPVLVSREKVSVFKSWLDR